MSKSSHAIIDDLHAFLREIRVISLATVDEHGLPHATNLYVAPDERVRFYFVTDRDSSHGHHIERQPHVAMTGYAPIRMWQQVRGIRSARHL